MKVNENNIDSREYKFYINPKYVPGMKLVFKIIQESRDFMIDRPFFYNIVKLIGSEEESNFLSLFNGYVHNPQ